MANNQAYLQMMKEATEHLHACSARHSGSVPVHEVFRGETIWQGTVEVFELTGHPKAKRCYTWGERKDANAPGAKFFAVLELPPVNSPESAVKAAIVGEVKGKR